MVVVLKGVFLLLLILYVCFLCRWCLCRNEIEVFQVPNSKYKKEEENTQFYICVVAIKSAVSDFKVIQHRGVKGLGELSTFDGEDKEKKLSVAEEIEQLDIYTTMEFQKSLTMFSGASSRERTHITTTQRTGVRTLDNYAKKSGHNGNGEVETGVQRCSRSVSRE